jgi:hypothetical protein
VRSAGFIEVLLTGAGESGLSVEEQIEVIEQTVKAMNDALMR